MWRYTASPVMLVVLDARACLPMLLCAVLWAWWTLYLAVGVTVIFMVISWFGLTVPATGRLVRRMLVGPVRPAVPVWRRRRLA